MAEETLAIQYCDYIIIIIYYIMTGKRLQSVNTKFLHITCLFHKAPAASESLIEYVC